MMTLRALIFYLLFIDSVIAVFLAFFGENWYIRHFRLMSRLFPVTKGWTIYYLVLVLYIGLLTFY